MYSGFQSTYLAISIALFDGKEAQPPLPSDLGMMMWQSDIDTEMMWHGMAPSSCWWHGMVTSPRRWCGMAWWRHLVMAWHDQLSWFIYLLFPPVILINSLFYFIFLALLFVFLIYYFSFIFSSDLPAVRIKIILQNNSHIILQNNSFWLFILFKKEIRLFGVDLHLHRSLIASNHIRVCS